jgi:cytochrome c
VRQLGIPEKGLPYSRAWIYLQIAGNFLGYLQVLYSGRAANMFWLLRTGFRLLYTGAIVAVALGTNVQAQENRDKTTASRGKEIFEQCSGCHSAETDETKVGPSLKGLFQRGKLHNGRAVTEKNVRSRIDQGGDGMPAFSDLLSNQEKIDLMSYLKAL